MFTGTRINYVLDGQHKFAAASAIREKLVQAEMPLPRWVTVFRCRRVKSYTRLDKRQVIAGRQQARSSTVMHQTLSQKLQWFLREVETTDEKVDSRASLLQKVYLKCGCTRATDGSLVCFPSSVCCCPTLP